MNNPKEIAEKMTSCLPDDVTGDDLQTLARAYLELEKENYRIRCEKQSDLNTISQLQFEINTCLAHSVATDANQILESRKLNYEITKLKEENENLKHELEATTAVYNMNRQYIEDTKKKINQLSEENLKLEEENEKLSEQVFKDVEYINYTQEQLELSKSVLLQKTLEIDSLRNPIEYLNKLAVSIHKTNVEAGWWTNLETGEPLERNVGELLCLVHSEVSEALEAYRKDLNDDKLPHRKGFEVELVDALIRIFDIAGKFKLDLDGALEDKLEYNAKRSDHKLENRQGKNGKKF